MDTSRWFPSACAVSVIQRKGCTQPIDAHGGRLAWITLTRCCCLALAACPVSEFGACVAYPGHARRGTSPALQPAANTRLGYHCYPGNARKAVFVRVAARANAQRPAPPAAETGHARAAGSAKTGLTPRAAQSRAGTRLQARLLCGLVLHEARCCCSRRSEPASREQ